MPSHPIDPLSRPPPSSVPAPFTCFLFHSVPSFLLSRKLEPGRRNPLLFSYRRLEFRARTKSNSLSLSLMRLLLHSWTITRSMSCNRRRALSRLFFLFITCFSSPLLIFMDLRTENTFASPTKLKSTLLSVTPHPTHTGALLFAVKQVALRPNLSSFRKGKKKLFS